MRSVVVAIVLTCATSAFAEPTEAQRRFAVANEHFTAGRYDQALVELEAARAADPQPEYLWAIAQTHRLKGDCARAIKAYGDYLRTGPPPAATRVTQQAIDSCIVAAPKIEPAAPAAPILPAPPPSEPLIIREVQRVHTHEVTLPWYRDMWGNALVGTGILLGVGGVVAYVIADSHADNARIATSYERFDSETARADRARLIGNITFVAAGSFVIGGLLHYALRPKRVKTEVLIDPAGKSAGAAVTWTLP